MILDREISAAEVEIQLDYQPDLAAIMRMILEGPQHTERLRPDGAGLPRNAFRLDARSAGTLTTRAAGRPRSYWCRAERFLGRSPQRNFGVAEETLRRKTPLMAESFTA